MGLEGFLMELTASPQAVLREHDRILERIRAAQDDFRRWPTQEFLIDGTSFSVYRASRAPQGADVGEELRTYGVLFAQEGILPCYAFTTQAYEILAWDILTKDRPRLAGVLTHVYRTLKSKDRL